MWIKAGGRVPKKFLAKKVTMAEFLLPSGPILSISRNVCPCVRPIRSSSPYKCHLFMPTFFIKRF